MAERPIIMQPRSVRDILAGRKTQTRRLPPKRITAGCIPRPHDLLWVREAHTHDEVGLVIYRADWPDGHPRAPRWTSPLFLPRADARLWLRVTGVRAERLYDLTDEDARAEGYADRREYMAAWRAMHGRAENVLVTVITFEVVPRG